MFRRPVNPEHEQREKLPEASARPGRLHGAPYRSGRTLFLPDRPESMFTS